MKKIQLLAVLVFTVVLSSFTVESNVAAVSKIEVINFHSTNRCATCKAIEANTKYTLATYFAKQMKAGTITNQVVNVDEKANEKIAEKFEASGTSLFLNVIKNGKETKIDLSDFAFMKASNKEAFSKELKAKIDAEFKKI